ncbi:hypothetical protein ACFTWD_38130 [Streptomyces sp. NPDC056943]|uniref:hypothetical protein n=1 Tax=Streptomyces sp. NPDC056943 TaxID=3345971 RepID=UPI0036373D0D
MSPSDCGTLRLFCIVVAGGHAEGHPWPAETEGNAMYGDRDGWERDGFESHEGVAGVLQADGSEPGPVYFDLGSGSSFHESIGWWQYDGTMGRPTATSMRGRCACG